MRRRSPEEALEAESILMATPRWPSSPHWGVLWLQIPAVPEKTQQEQREADGEHPLHTGWSFTASTVKLKKKKKRAENDGLELFLLLLTHHCIESGFLPGFGGSKLDLHWEWGVWQLGDVPARAPTLLLPCPLFFLLLLQPSW